VLLPKSSTLKAKSRERYAIRYLEAAEARNGKALLLAHGYWPESMPLEMGDDWGNPLSEALIEEGWIVAFSSYRRAGWIMEDAARDLENLYELVAAAAQGEALDVYVMGDSMGGGIATLLAEDPGGRFDGVLAMGAYLFGPIGGAADGAADLGAHFSLKPRIPILYLTNISELEGPEAYVAAALAAEAPVLPALWKVHRPGHVNLNVAERRAALRALIDWVETGEVVREKDGTVRMSPPSTAELAGDTARGEAIRLVPVYGNFITSFVREDFETLGIEIGDRFALTAGDMTVSVLMGESYGDVGMGDWVGFWDADGYLLICRNYQDAVGTMGLVTGAEVVVEVPESAMRFHSLP
jgi:pimeloyl-ACP methyl ester carboxylesterase